MNQISTALLWPMSLGIGLFTGVAFFGSTNPVAEYLLGLWASLVAVGAWASMPGQPQRGKKYEGALWILLGLPLLWALIQLVPVSSVPFLYPMAHPVWSQVAEIIPVPGATISLVPYTGRSLLAFMVSMLVLAMATFHVGRNPEKTAIILKVLAVVGGLHMVWAIGVYVAGNQYVFYLPKTSYKALLSGTFVNKNTFATFAGLSCLLAWGAMLLRVGEIPSAARASLKERWKLFMGLVVEPGWAWGMLGVIGFMALMLSQSRAGMISSMAGLIVFWLALMVGARGARLFLAGGGALVLGGLLLILSQLAPMVSPKMERLTSDAVFRSNLFDLTNQASQLNPWVGSGLGSFETVFRTVRDARISPAITARIDHAHNTWLELGLTLGWPMLALLVVAILLWGGAMLVGLKTRRRGVVYPALGLGGGTLLAGHAYVDFSLQIPAFTAFAAVFAGLTLAGSLRQPAPLKEEESTQATPQTPWVKMGLATLAAVACAWQAYGFWHVSPAESMATRYREGENLTSTEKQQAIGIYLQASASNPTYLKDAAMLEMASLGDIPQTETAKRQEALVTIENHLQQALGVAPADPFSWARLGQIKGMLGKDDEASGAWMQSLLTGPYEGALVKVRLPYLLAMAPSMGQADRDYLNLYFNQLKTSTRDKTIKELLKQIP